MVLHILAHCIHAPLPILTDSAFIFLTITSLAGAAAASTTSPARARQSPHHPRTHPIPLHENIDLVITSSPTRDSTLLHILKPWYSKTQDPPPSPLAADPWSRPDQRHAVAKGFCRSLPCGALSVGEAGGRVAIRQ